jgi:hypothetical protein
MKSRREKLIFSGSGYQKWGVGTKKGGIRVHMVGCILYSYMKIEE